MARAVYEERNFTNNRGEIVKYPWYGIQATVNGEYMELPLKNLDSAEKIAFKMIATGEDPKNYSTVSRPATEDEKDSFFSSQKRDDDDKINLDDDD